MIPTPKQTPHQPRFSNLFRIKRQQLGLTQKDVARLLDLNSASHIAEYEHSHKYPSVLRLIDLAIILHEPRLDELFPDLYAARHQQITARRMNRDNGAAVANGTKNNADTLQPSH